MKKKPDPNRSHEKNKPESPKKAEGQPISATEKDNTPDNIDKEAEKRIYKEDETDEQDSDGSANAFEGK